MGSQNTHLLKIHRVFSNSNWVAPNNFKKTGINKNKTLNRHSYFCFKWNNIKTTWHKFLLCTREVCTWRFIFCTAITSSYGTIYCLNTMFFPNLLLWCCLTPQGQVSSFLLLYPALFRTKPKETTSLPLFSRNFHDVITFHETQDKFRCRFIVLPPPQKKKCYRFSKFRYDETALICD